MRKTAMLSALTFGFVLLVTGTEFAVNKMCPDNCRGTAGDDLVRGGTVERPNDGARDVLDCGEGTDYFVEGQDTVRDCEFTNPPQ